MMGYWGYGYGPDIFGGIMMLVFLAIIIASIFALVRFFGGGKFSDRSDRRGENVPLDILKERYAKGEINKAEFEEKKKDLAS